MYLPDIRIFTGIIQKQPSIDAILQSNKISQKYGLILTPNDALEIVAACKRSITDHNRIELGLETVNKIISAFCSSPYINQVDYASTLMELVDIFYATKTLTEDKIPDDELIALVQSLFDNSCRGSLDLLKNRELTMFVKLLGQAGL